MGPPSTQAGQPRLIIAPLAAVEGVAAAQPEIWVCGLLGPEMAQQHPALPSVPEERRLRLSLHDISMPRPGHVMAAPEQLLQLLEFAGRWQQAARQGRAGALLLHCWFGISRSPAAAFIVQCALRPQEAEETLAQELRQVLPMATPNARMVALADALLGRNGRMQAAIRRIGRGQEAGSGEVAHWPLTADDG